MDSLPGRSGISTSDSGYMLVTGSWGRLLDGSGEAGSSGIMVTLGSIPRPTLLVLTRPVCVVQSGKVVGWWAAAFLGEPTLVVQVGTSHRVRKAVDVDIGG